MFFYGAFGGMNVALFLEPCGPASAAPLPLLRPSLRPRTRSLAPARSSASVELSLLRPLLLAAALHR